MTGEVFAIWEPECSVDPSASSMVRAHSHRGQLLRSDIQIGTACATCILVHIDMFQFDGLACCSETLLPGSSN